MLRIMKKIRRARTQLSQDTTEKAEETETTKEDEEKLGKGKKRIKKTTRGRVYVSE